MKVDTLTIKKNMGLKNITGKNLAAQAGISRQTLCIILGRGTCSVPSAVKIAAALGVELEEIAKEV